ncbi:substrate-binding domain-containing protein [Leptodesmis sichuanensis A121]|nr:substrate-binding domain-containing protein [Leptodesmis sichuanensis]UIE36369.1 substrate-binding domain-containing protein [Leptodesmis sichuanensis A121]
MSGFKLTSKSSRWLTSVGIILVALGLTYAPIPGWQQTIIVVSGTELEEPLRTLQASFEKQYPSIKLKLEFQGSQDIINRYLDNKNDFKPTVLIPANGEILSELNERWRTQNRDDPFYEAPRPIAKTMLVAIAWPDRGKTLFPDGQFRWERVEQAMQASSWGAIGGPPSWGSFDFLTTDPTRSNSGQLTLTLWAQSKVNGNLNTSDLSSPTIQDLFSLIKRSVYQPPRSTDVLLQEFIARGSNDADVAMTYESDALYRWQQAKANQGKPYQIYYLNPTIETTATAAIVRREVSDGKAQAARKFLDFLVQPAQQQVLVQYGFRPINAAVDLPTVPNSPWSQKIPGATAQPTGTILPPPERQIAREVIRQWERAK